jgi:hypothetical protein
MLKIYKLNAYQLILLVFGQIFMLEVKLVALGLPSALPQQ